MVIVLIGYNLNQLKSCQLVKMRLKIQKKGIQYIYRQREREMVLVSKHRRPLDARQ